MTYLLTIFTLLSTYANAQQKKPIYFDIDWKKTSQEEATYYREYYKDENQQYAVTDYFMDGIVQMTGHFTEKSLSIKDGEFNYFNHDSEKTLTAHYNSGKLNGSYISFYPGNKIKNSKYYSDGELEGEYLEYYLDGKIRAKAYFKKGFITEKAQRFSQEGNTLLNIDLDEQRTGQLKSYHENGQLKKTGNFFEGFRNSEWVTYDTLGKRLNSITENEIITFKKVSVAHEIEQNKKNKNKFKVLPYHSVEDEYFAGFDFPGEGAIVNFPDEEAEYIGGPKALQIYIAQNVQYPEKAMKKNVQGMAYISFVVEKDGSISNVRYLLGPKLLKAESIRLVQGMPVWKPGAVKGVPARTRCQIPINFTLK